MDIQRDQGNESGADRVPNRVEDPGDRSSLSGGEAFTAYVLPEIEVLGRVAMTLTRRAADAEDLVQETLLRAWRSIDQFDGRHPRAWLLTIMRNANVNMHRRKRPDLLRDDEEARSALESAEPSASAETEHLAGQFDRAVTDALMDLGADARRVVALVDVDGLSYAEAAEVLDIPVGTVMSRLHRARRRIRSKLPSSILPGGRS